ncbi:DUF2779 domain-containing protein [Candidatus Parcubacteria bacterium]|nr:DUF2779 domain-containing protein [Candidatus Parcubacteria bacterium]
MKWLTKSDYLKYLISPAYLWLAKHAKDKLPPFDEAGEMLVAQGNEVEEYARRLYPGGALVKSLFQEAVRETEQLVRDGSSTLFQATVLTGRRLYCRADVLQRRGGGWELTEVKSSARVKDDHIHDLAFQKIALEEAGYRIDKVLLIYVNSRYRRQGEVDPARLLVRRDVTRKVAAVLDVTRGRIDRALAVVASPRCPEDDPAACGNLYAWLKLYRHLNPDLAPENIYRLCRLTLDQVKRFRAAGITKISDIPVSFKLTPPQRAQLELTRLRRASIHHSAVARELAGLRYPLQFLDYETVGPAVPLFEGTRPFRALPFQYSLHILPEPGGQLIHKQYLARGTQYPALALLEQLQADLRPEGSVVVWFKPFEMGANDYLAELHPEYGEFLAGVNARVYDLMEIFSNHLYGHPSFGGSASIKKVLPVLIPDMSYQQLGIQEGMAASNGWLRAARGQLADHTRDKLYDDLIKYCGQDTLAMVRIYQHLMEVCAPGRPQLTK